METITINPADYAVRLTTTLNRIKEHKACPSRYEHLIAALGGVSFDHDAPINLLTILERNGTEDCLWALCATTQNCDQVARLMAADFAEAVLPIFERWHPADMRPRDAINLARACAIGRVDAATGAAAGVGAAAWAAAWSSDGNAAWAAASAASAVWTSGDDAGAASWTAVAAARDAAWASTGDAAGVAAWASAGDAWDAARASAASSAWADARTAAAAAQAEIIKRYLLGKKVGAEWRLTTPFAQWKSLVIAVRSLRRRWELQESLYVGLCSWRIVCCGLPKG